MAHMTGYPILGITPHSIKLLIIDREDKDFHVLSYYEESHSAIKNGNLIDANELVEKIKLVYEKTNFFLNTDINEGILVFPEVQSVIVRSEVGIELAQDSSEISYKHIKELLGITSRQVHAPKHILLNIFPVEFTVGEINHIDNPVGLIGKSLMLDSYSVSVPETFFMNVLHNIEQAGIKVTEIFPHFLGNIKEVTYALNKQNGIIIDFDYNHTMFVVYKDGIPQKNRMIRKGIKGLVDILSEKYQISSENAMDLLRSSVYFDEATAEDIVVYRLELPTGVLDITEQDLAQTLSGYLDALFFEIKGMLEHFNSYADYPLIFVGKMNRLTGFKELVQRHFDEHELYFHTTDVVGLREFNAEALVGCARSMERRERLLQKNLETVRTKEQDIDIFNKVKVDRNENTLEEKKEQKFWEKITNYFFD